MATRNYKKVNGRTLMQVGARWIDVTEFNSKQREDIYNQSSGGKGSKASQEYADKLRGKKPPTTSKKQPPSNVGDGLGSTDSRVKVDFNNPQSVIEGQKKENQQAAGDSNESKNPLQETDINGNTKTTKFDPVTGRAITEVKAGGLVDALQGGDKEAIARERARLGMSAYGTGDVSADRRRVEDGLIARYDEIYAPQKEKDYQKTRTELINSGFVPGSKAYNDQMFELDRRYNDAKSQYAAQALDRGLGEYKGLTEIDNSQRTQSVNEATAIGKQLNDQKPDFKAYEGTNVDPTNITGVWGQKETGKVSTANTAAQIAAAERARREEAALENARRQGESQGDPGAGQRAGEGLGGFASNQSAVANLGTQVNLPGSMVTGAPTQSTTVPAAGTQATLPGSTLNTTPAVNSNLPATGQLPGTMVTKPTSPPPTTDQNGNVVRSAAQYSPTSNAPTAGTMAGNQLNPSTPAIGTTPQANIKPVKQLVSNRNIATSPNRSTINTRGKYNPFGNKTGFLIGKNKAL